MPDAGTSIQTGSGGYPAIRVCSGTQGGETILSTRTVETAIGGVDASNTVAKISGVDVGIEPDYICKGMTFEGPVTSLVLNTFKVNGEIECTTPAGRTMYAELYNGYYNDPLSFDINLYSAPYATRGESLSASLEIRCSYEQR